MLLQLLSLEQHHFFQGKYVQVGSLIGLIMDFRCAWCACLFRPPSVLISTCVDAKLRQAITRTVERLGGTVTSSPADFSVFITLDAARGIKDRGFTKSLNALSALASGDSSYSVTNLMKSNGASESMKRRKNATAKRRTRTISLIHFLA